jgi:hypothetical protein
VYDEKFCGLYAPGNVDMITKTMIDAFNMQVGRIKELMQIFRPGNIFKKKHEEHKNEDEFNIEIDLRKERSDDESWMKVAQNSVHNGRII